MIQAFDKMMFPTLADTDANLTPEMIDLRDHGLDYYINVADEFQIPPFQNIFDKKITVAQILVHADNVTKTLKLDDKEAFKKHKAQLTA